MKLCTVILREAVRQTDRLYTYAIPHLLEASVACGSYCLVPFGRGNKLTAAVVTQVYSDDGKNTKDSMEIKQIDSLISDYPVLNGDQLTLIDKFASRFNCTRGDCVELMVPSCALTHKAPLVTMVSIKDKDNVLRSLKANTFRSQAHVNILEFLLSNGDCERKMLLNNCKATPSQLKCVIEKDLVMTYKIRAEETDTLPAADGLSLQSGVSEKFTTVYDLNQEQSNAVDVIMGVKPGRDGTYGKRSAFLLYGITGSGKTEVYLNVASKILEQGGSVLYLVPEISLTPQTINWIVGRLGDSVAVLHSRLTDRQRYIQWDNIRRGKARVVVAPRSGIFAPVVNLKLIIIDEEHDSSYKSETYPRYQTRDVARMRAAVSGAKVLFGSATPSVESFYAAQVGAYELIELKHRAHGEATLPEIVPVDMKEQVKLGAGDMLSIPLRSAMARAFSHNRQVMLFLNRRGYARTLVCTDCGSTVTCPRCSVSMTIHNNRRSGTQNLICHYCGEMLPVEQAVCGSCGSKTFKHVGFGTQQLEELLKTLYPGEKILRMDQDTTMSPDAHREILEQFAAKKASVLVGTQMIAKGLDFPDVTVVGVLGTDLMLASSSYHASEKAFQLITQAAGRAGRGDNPGTVYIQSFNPDLPLFKFACSQDYMSFYRSEISYRQKLQLPPFKAIGEMVLSLESEDELSDRAGKICRYLKDFLSYQSADYGFELFGPFPDVIYELRGRYRMDFIIKARNKSAINAVFKRVIEDFDHRLYPISFNNDA